VVEIEKSVIRPTYAEWVDIYSLGKEIRFYRTGPYAEGRPVLYGPINPLPIYQKAVEENIEITQKDMPDISNKINYDLFRLKGFNSMSQAKKYIAVMKNPDIKNIDVFIDGEEEIVKLNFLVRESGKTIDTSKYIFSPKRISYSSGQLFNHNNGVINKINAETTKVKLFNFENSESVDVYFAEYGEAGYDPIKGEFTEGQDDDFLPKVEILAEHISEGDDISKIKEMLKENNVYFIPNVNGKTPKALNRLTSGKKLNPVSIYGFSPDAKLNYSGNKRNFNEVLPQLEPLPNEYKKYEEQLNEVFEPKSTKKLIKRMQYLTRLEARKAREGRGVGKYTGDREFDKNRPKLYFTWSLVRGVYSPQTKRYEDINILAFFIERDNTLEPADDVMLFVNEAFVPSYFAESDRNKDWAEISWNIAKDAVEGIIAYAKDLQTRYRSRRKLNFDTMSEKMINAFDINLNEIMENSFFGFVSFDKRRGKRLKVRKSNMLKSASDIKNTFNEVLNRNFGPFKEIKDLNKEEMQVFITEIRGFYRREYNFADTRFNIEFEYIPYDDAQIDTVIRNETTFNADDIIRRKNSLDGDLKQYFSIRNKSAVGEESLMGVLVICYYYNGDELDRIEAVSIVQQRIQYRPNIVQQASKDISIVYPADEIGVFMYEIMTGMRRNTPLILGRKGGSVSASPSKVAQNFFQEYLGGTFKEIESEGGFVINNMKYNELRNDFVGYLVGRNGINKMYQFLYSDSTLQGTEGADTICVGKMDLFYKIDESGFRGEGVRFLMDIEDFEDFKNKVTIGLNATQSGSCINMTAGVPKGDFLPVFASMFLGGTGSDKDFLEGNINSYVIAGDSGIGGTNTSRIPARVRLHAELYKKFGSQFGEFIDSLVRKAVESGEIKLGAKYLRRGTSSGSPFNPNMGNHAIIYRPPNIEQSKIKNENFRQEVDLDEGPDDEEN
jgi:hypothetical protein